MYIIYISYIHIYIYNCTSWTIAFSRFGLYPQYDTANAYGRHTYFAIKAVEKLPAKQTYESGAFDTSQRLNHKQRSITIDSNWEIFYQNPFQDGKTTLDLL